MEQKKIIIVGAGLVGSLLGIFLARRGHSVTIYERRPDMRKESMSAGRSINLALSDRGLRALEAVGIADEIRAISIPMPGRLIHTGMQTGFQPYGREGQAILSVSRGELNKKLMDLAERHGITILFNRKCSEVNWDSMELVFEDAFADRQEVQQADIVFGADGAFAATRLQHMLQHDHFDYHQYYIDCGYKELSIPAGRDGSFQLEKNALHIWPRRDFMLIALPNTDGSFTGTLFFPFHGKLSFENLRTEDDVKNFFNEQFPDVVPMIPDLTTQYFSNPVSSLVTVKCFPWAREAKFCMIGDAAHAIVPFFGQGMNCGFEDCFVLNELIDQYGDDWQALFNAFQDHRKPDADAIADLAIANFVEMRAKTADARFLLQKKIEARIHEKYPEKWIPAYSQVTFQPNIRYSEALSNAERQERIMQEVMRMPDIEKKWDSKEIEETILKLVDQYNN